MARDKQIEKSLDDAQQNMISASYAEDAEEVSAYVMAAATQAAIAQVCATLEVAAAMNRQAKATESLNTTMATALMGQYPLSVRTEP